MGFVPSGGRDLLAAGIRGQPEATRCPHHILHWVRQRRIGAFSEGNTYARSKFRADFPPGLPYRSLRHRIESFMTFSTCLPGLHTIQTVRLQVRIGGPPRREKGLIFNPESDGLWL